MATPPPDSVSVQGTLGDVAFTEEIPRPLGNKKIKRIIISKAKVGFGIQQGYCRNGGLQRLEDTCHEEPTHLQFFTTPLHILDVDALEYIHLWRMQVS